MLQKDEMQRTQMKAKIQALIQELSRTTMLNELARNAPTQTKSPKMTNRHRTYHAVYISSLLANFMDT